MKFTLLSAAGIIAAISQASAVTIVTPWANTVWTAGQLGDITWNATAADAGLKCDIYLLNGDYKNSNIVAQVTNPATPVDCSIGKYAIHPLGDFASGDVWIRIGQASTGNWAYSGVFKFVGNGTSVPASVVGAPSAAVANGTASSVPASKAASAPVTAVPSATGLKNATAAAASASASVSASASGADSAMNVNTAAVALGAIAAIAFAL